MNSCHQQPAIIIPIYNAYESLISCIDSVLTHTDLSDAKLILVDDKSTDQRIAPYLEQVRVEHDEITLLQNEENLGFAASVNRAAEQTDCPQGGFERPERRS